MWWSLLPLLGHFFISDASAAGWCSRLLAPLRVDRAIVRQLRIRAYPVLRKRVTEFDRDIDRAAEESISLGARPDVARNIGQISLLIKLGYSMSVAQRLLKERPDLGRKILLRKWAAFTGYRGVGVPESAFSRSTGEAFWVYAERMDLAHDFTPNHSGNANVRIIIEMNLPYAFTVSPFRVLFHPGENFGDMNERFDSERKINPKFTTDQFLFASRVRRVLPDGSLGEWTSAELFLDSLKPTEIVPEFEPVIIEEALAPELVR